MFHYGSLGGNAGTESNALALPSRNRGCIRNVDSEGPHGAIPDSAGGRTSRLFPFRERGRRRRHQLRQLAVAEREPAAAQPAMVRRTRESARCRLLGVAERLAGTTVTLGR